MEITLKDVKDFLNTLNLVWKGEIVKSNGDVIIAQSFEDLDNGMFNQPKLIKLYRDNKLTFQRVVVDEISFNFYTLSGCRSDIDLTFDYELKKDCTDLWIKFLLKKYGKDYGDYAKHICSLMKKRDIDRSQKELSSLNAQKNLIVNNLKHQLQHYQKLNNIIDCNDNFNK